MKELKNITLREGYGVVGMAIELNLAQIQVLGSIFKSLTTRNSLVEDLSQDEKDLLPFLEIFKDFSLDRDNVWSNFKKPEENNMMP